MGYHHPLNSGGFPGKVGSGKVSTAAVRDRKDIDARDHEEGAFSVGLHNYNYDQGLPTQRGDEDDGYCPCGCEKKITPGARGDSFSTVNDSGSWSPPCGSLWCRQLWAMDRPCYHRRIWSSSGPRVTDEHQTKISSRIWSREGESRSEDDGDREDALSSLWSLAMLVKTEPTGMGAGLDNLGNTCFMNAILQCVTHTVPFVTALRSCNHATPCTVEVCIHCDLRGHINLCLASSGKTVSPTTLFDNLQYISPDFRQFEQADAHEFLLCLLDRVGKCCLESNAGLENSVSQEEKKKKNIVEQVFGGRLLNKLRCCNCGHPSRSYEPLIDLSLPIEGVDTLQDALQSFTRTEKIEDVVFTCDNCNEEVWKERQVLLDRLPAVVVVQLKRFKTDGIRVEKIERSIEFPLELDFKPYTNCSEDNNVDLKYQLYAVVVHEGSSLTNGHYFCHIRSSPNTWHKLDDEEVIELDEQCVLDEAAYILLYVKEDIPWFSTFFESEKLCVESNKESVELVSENVGVVDSSLSNLEVAETDNPEVNVSINPEMNGNVNRKRKSGPKPRPRRDVIIAIRRISKKIRKFVHRKRSVNRRMRS